MRLRRLIRPPLVVIAALAVTLGVEIWLASRVERLEPFDRSELDGLVGAEPGEPISLVWIGDSTGAGVGASEPDRALPRLVASGLPCRVDLSVLAISGARVEGAIADQLPQVPALEPDWVVVAIGANDVTHGTSRASFAHRLDRLLEGVARARPSRIVVLGVPEFAATPLLKQPLRALAGKRADALDPVARAAAERHGAIFVDIKGETGPSFVADPDRFHAADGFHPSDEGYALWARATLDAIRSARASC